MASQIISLTIVYSTVYSGADQRKHQSSASLAFVGEFTGDRWTVHKWPVTRKMFPFDDIIMCFHLMTSSCKNGVCFQCVYIRIWPGIRTFAEPSCVATSAETLEVRSSVRLAWTLVQARITRTAIAGTARYSWSDTFRALCAEILSATTECSVWCRYNTVNSL